MADSPDTSNYGRGFKQPGLGSVGAYQVAGFPFVTGSMMGVPSTAYQSKEVVFPSVTKSITLFPTKNAEFVLCFADPDNSRVGSQGHTVKFPLSSSANAGGLPLQLDVKCSRVWVVEDSGLTTGLWSMFASLTNINPGPMYTLSGSGINV